MAAKDLYIDKTTNDLVIVNGDFKVDYSDDTHIQDHLVSDEGHWKNDPLVGVGIIKYLNSPAGPSVYNDLERKIRVKLKYDDTIIKTLKIDSLKSIKIDASRND